MATYSDLVLYQRVLRETRAFWPHIVGTGIVGALSGPIQLLAPLPLKITVDSVLGSHPLPPLLEMLLPASAPRSTTELLVLVAIVSLAIGLLQRFQWLASGVIHTYTREKLVLAFRARLMSHVQQLSLSYHDTEGSMDSVYRIQYDAPAVGDLAIDGVIPFVSAGVTLVGIFWVTALIDWQLALVALTVTPLLLLLTLPSRGRLRAAWEKASKLESSSIRVVQEALAALRVVKAFGQEEYERHRFVQRASQSVHSRIRLAGIEGILLLLTGMTTVVGTTIVLVVGAIHTQNGSLSLGELLLIVAYLAQLYGPLQSISNNVVHIQSSLAGVQRAFALLDEAPNVSDRPDARPLARATGAIRFQDVSFAYRQGPPVLSGISFDILPGTRLGIAGTTGSGKSTLIGLLTRFYDPSSGQIFLDGVDLRDYRLKDLRQQFAVVLQDSVLFSTSIAENIAYGRPGASAGDIVEAAKAANSHNFIRDLPTGYETLVGERGMQLSGGERQRIAVARAFLRDAPILVLDEPTSSVDVETEAEIMEAMDRLMSGRTTLMIAHRLSTLKDCDLMAVVERGRLSVAASSLPQGVKRTAAQHRSEAAADDDEHGLLTLRPRERK
jgi:ATP-binding cassette subfamily B protein